MHNIPPRHPLAPRSGTIRWRLVAVVPWVVWAVGWIGLAAQSTPPVAFVHVNVIDGTGAPLKADQTVVVANGRIVNVGRGADVVVPDGTRNVDGTGKFLMPGLWDAHVHTRPEGIDHLRLSIVNA